MSLFLKNFMIVLEEKTFLFFKTKTNLMKSLLQKYFQDRIYQLQTEAITL